ncbi:MAG: type III-A CRISPR-associated RAMP protein Csm5 [Bryobacterales bacterium]|nr:type III-A CRISPR-associated RAMP protein Csm5 [Bryobacterales bacterium]
MKYRLEVLTPTLVGDGAALAPIDYMVWKDQVNVLDQKRIFRLLAKGSRLDNYLAQVKKADKLDFASWGGFAQNFAGRRIPFEHPNYTQYWEKLPAEGCFIPTFATLTGGPYLPGSALKGALRTALLAAAADEKTLEAAAGQRRPGDAFESRAMHKEAGRSGADLLKALGVGDSRTVPVNTLKVYMLRTATLVEMRPPQKGIGLGWKQSGRGSVDSRRIEDSTPLFAEMAQPGSAFEGAWEENDFYSKPEIVRALHWRGPLSRERLLTAANDYAKQALAAHRQFATMTGLTPLLRTLDKLDHTLAEASASGSCLLALGWGTGLFGKTAWPKVQDENYRKIMAEQPYYARAIRTGLPFPKTRQVVFTGNQPGALAGWVKLSLS